MQALTTAGAGFLLAVLWFDLMFDTQVWPYRHGDVPQEVLASIAGYYRRVTTGARPMNRLVAIAMAVTLVGILAELARGDVPGWVAWLSLVLAALPIGVAGARTVPSAVRLGARAGSATEQQALAKAILQQHLGCAAAIFALLVVQLAGASAA